MATGSKFTVKASTVPRRVAEDYSGAGRPEDEPGRVFSRALCEMKFDRRSNLEASVSRRCRHAGPERFPPNSSGGFLTRQAFLMGEVRRCAVKPLAEAVHRCR